MNAIFVEPNSPAWPQRPLLCVDCRITLLRDEHCGEPAHRSVSLSEAGGRRELVAQAWDASGLHRSVPATPRGVDVPALTGKLPDFSGWVDAPEMSPEPFTNHPCVAFCVQLELTNPPGAVSLRDAPTIGFQVRADDGKEVAIPRGRIDMRLRPEHKRYVNHAFGLREYMESLDPQRHFDQPFDPLPYDRVALGLLRVGDRVAIHNVRAVPDPRGVDVGYRQSPHTVLRAFGVPIISLVD